MAMMAMMQLTGLGHGNHGQDDVRHRYDVVDDGNADAQVGVFDKRGLEGRQYISVDTELGRELDLLWSCDDVTMMATMKGQQTRMMLTPVCSPSHCTVLRTCWR